MAKCFQCGGEHTGTYSCLPPEAPALTKPMSLRDALEMLIREAQAVADDHHRPRYVRLDEALESAREALAGSVHEPSGDGAKV